MRRLLIYLTYDRQNIIDDYIGYFLQSMQSVAESVVAVCNMPRVEKGLHHLENYAEHVFYRENVGLDAGGFKDALCTFIGWDKIKEYDELILANDSFYGPFEDVSRIFDEMESRRLDFWGLMKRGAGQYGQTGNDPEHILSFFYVFQAPLIHSKEFRDYWEDMPYYQDYRTVVKQYERQLTRYFSELGYTYDAYADTAPNETKNLKNQFFQCDYLSYEMIRKRGFPFLKRKQMAYNALSMQTQENLALSMDYVEKHTDYNVNLIWKNLIRTQHHTELQRSLGLQYILEGSEEKKHPEVLVCVRAGWENAADTVCEYLENLRNICDVQIIADSEELAAYYQNRGWQAIAMKGSDIAILRGIDNGSYRYFCLLHDADLSSEQFPSCTGKSYFFNLWENLLKSAGYIDSVVKLLDAKPYLGMLMHPAPIFSTWIGQINFEWKNRYKEVKQYLEELGVCAVIDPQIPPVNVTDNFWVRADVIHSFAEKWRQASCRDVIPEKIYSYLWGYIVQDYGQLTGIVESTFYASMNEVNYHYYLRTFLSWFTDRYGSRQYLYEFKELFYVQLSAEQCRDRYETWYVYGTGEIAERCFGWIRDAAAFIVSDGLPKKETFHGKPVIYLSELKLVHEFGVVLCLSKANQDNVIRILEEKGIHNYYAIY